MSEKNKLTTQQKVDDWFARKSQAWAETFGPYLASGRDTEDSDEVNNAWNAWESRRNALLQELYDTKLAKTPEYVETRIQRVMEMVKQLFS